MFLRLTTSYAAKTNIVINSDEISHFQPNNAGGTLFSLRSAPNDPVAVTQTFEQVAAMLGAVAVESVGTQSQYPPCQGMNCGATDGVSHSRECYAEHAATLAGGKFVKGDNQYD